MSEQPRAETSADDRRAAVLSALTTVGETFEVPLSGGVSITFRIPRDADEVYRLRDGGARWCRMLEKHPSPAHKPYLPISPKAASAAWWVHQLAAEPTLSEYDALQIAKTGGSAIVLLEAYIQQHVAGALMAEASEEIDAAGEG